ncbi:threonine aldolase family protein [Glacieibacterium megasporae]|uniref:threonine aldolase family protein n=1 Tax=Glacieibacterium megasporae TaxID=2835787 RepID=UPI001C1E2A72|nr:beta-eliminating lyase-related protein [Polymorphobacter megasporae]UAJ11770.1 low specificity L-threonine aldolase [Polymorphobacter megasporae]
MNFQSDNAASVCPEVLAAVVEANVSTTGAYDADPWTERLDAVYSDVFATACTVLPVSTGTAANALALAAMVPPYGAVACHAEAHIHVDECGAPEFFTGGAKLLTCQGLDGKLSPESVATSLAAHRGGVHQVQIGALSITQATECGTIYTPDEVAALSDYAKSRGWKVHMDGARFANSLVSLGCRPADITSNAGVDILSLGVIKNGGMTAEAMIIFDPTLVEAIRFRRKRAGQMPSKGRFNAAQLLAYVETNAWLRNAARANAGAARLAAAFGDRIAYPVEANEVFANLGPGGADRLRNAGFTFYDWGDPADHISRFVVAWDTPDGNVEALAAAVARLA